MGYDTREPHGWATRRKRLPGDPHFRIFRQDKWTWMATCTNMPGPGRSEIFATWQSAINWVNRQFNLYL